MAHSRTSTSRRLFEAVRYHGFGAATALLFVAPLAWSVLVNFKPSVEARQPPLPPWPVEGFSVQSYENLEQHGPGIWTYTGNSLAVSIATVLASVIISLLAGYGLPGTLRDMRALPWTPTP